ncbi:MAG: hypothetical protein WCO77_01565 [bacterium]
MNVDYILSVMNRHDVNYLLIGGMNFLLRHKPVMTYDVDFWIEDVEANRRACEQALSELNAEWGSTEGDWGKVAQLPVGWLARQSVYCLASPHGAIDVFRAVRGLSSWRDSDRTAISGKTADGFAYRGLSDEDMLACQLCLEPEIRKEDRIRELRKALEQHG